MKLLRFDRWAIILSVVTLSVFVISLSIGATPGWAMTANWIILLGVFLNSIARKICYRVASSATALAANGFAWAIYLASIADYSSLTPANMALFLPGITIYWLICIGTLVYAMLVGFEWIVKPEGLKWFRIKIPAILEFIAILGIELLIAL